MAEKELAEIQAGSIHRLAAYWTARSQSRHLPSRQDIDPVDLDSDLLPWLILTEIHRHPLRARFRLVGTGITRLQGDFTGTWVDEMHSPAWIEKWMDQYRRLISQKQPIFGKEDVMWHGALYCTYEWAIFPLAADGKTVDMALEIENHPKQLSIDTTAGTDNARGVPFGTQPREN